MIKTQIVKEGKKPIAVLMDYKEYKRLKEIEEDKYEAGQDPGFRANGEMVEEEDHQRHHQRKGDQAEHAHQVITHLFPGQVYADDLDVEDDGRGYKQKIC